MKIKDIKEYGFYQEIDQPTIIYEALQDEENGKEVLSIMIWDWMKISDGINFYRTDMFVLNPENEDICDIEVIPIDTKFKIVNNDDKYYAQYGASSVMYEDKPSNTEKIEKIKKICKKASTKTTFVSNGRDYTEVKDGQKLAIRILKVLEE